MAIDPVVLGTILPLVAGSLGLYLTFYILNKKRTRPLEYVGTVKELYVHPVKACRGVTVEEAECTWLGLKANGVYDRQFVVCDPSDDNRVVNIKLQFKLALVAADMNGEGDEIHLSFPGMENLSLPKTMEVNESNKIICHKWQKYFDAVDCGDAAAAWINQALETKKSLRLVCALNAMTERSTKFLDKNGRVVAGSGKKRFAPQFILPEQSTFNVLSQASLDELNRRLEKGVSIRHFRPNIVVEGCKPNDEDCWEEIVINEATFFQFDLAERCFITTVDPDNPEMGHYKKEPLATLRGYRKLPGYDAPLFGVRLGISHDGRIKVGDKVYAKRKV